MASLIGVVSARISAPVGMTPAKPPHNLIDDRLIEEAGSTQSEMFKIMERRLLKAIINPAMIITWLAGIYLAWAGLHLAWRRRRARAVNDPVRNLPQTSGVHAQLLSHAALRR